jgi:hypothetical protein
MPTRTASRRAIVAAAVGLGMSLSLVGCSQRGAGSTSCSLLFIPGDLLADNGRVVLLGTHAITATPWRPVPLDWPDGWTVRPLDDGQLEVVDDTGTVRARTGAGIVLSAVADPAGSGAWFRNGELVVCPGQWPDNYLDPDYAAPDGDAP